MNRKRTPINKDFLYKKYIIENLSINDIAKLVNMSYYMVQADVSFYGFKKTEVQLTECRSRTCLKNHGVSFPAQKKEIYDKVKTTCKRKYGTECSLQNENIKNKIRKTILKKFGVENVFQNDNIKKKIKETNLKKYGNESFTKTKLYLEKTRKTSENKYGIRCYQRKHISKTTENILINKDKFIEFIKNSQYKTLTYLTQQLQVDQTTILNYTNKYNIHNLLDLYTSSYEIEINKIYNNIFKKYRIGKLEVDLMYNNIGIEFNGDFWHSEKSILNRLSYSNNKHKARLYHQIKSFKFKEKGIFIFHIWEHEWNDIRKKPILISMINNLLNKNIERIYARKCIIKEISKKDKADFLNKNHIQGNDHSTIFLGLYYNDKLVSVMTFSKPLRDNRFEFELTRFSSLLNTNIIGGASKLFNFFIKKFKPKSIISYSDIAKTRGSLYNILGFKNTKIIPPSYKWFLQTNKIAVKSWARKNHLKKLNAIGNTEEEMVLNLYPNASKIYDAGLLRWEYYK